MTPSRDASSAPGLDALSGSPWATIIYGRSRSAVLRAAFALAKANDASPYWITIREPGEGVDPPGPLELGWLPRERVFLVSRRGARPTEALPRSLVWEVVRSDEPEEVVGELLGFLRLPESIQQTLGRYGGSGKPRVFVVANADRVRDVYPVTVEGVRPIVDAMLKAGALPIFAVVGPAGPARMAFDFVLELEDADPQRGAEGTLRFEKAPSGSGFRSGESHALPRFPSLLRALRGEPP
ncbi:MAG TPA: hypothetical protein VFG07_04875 [Thermoplasmata archaeon]|nr:hypothetical protein [Thermoplasmata archaeon]